MPGTVAWLGCLLLIGAAGAGALGGCAGRDGGATGAEGPPAPAAESPAAKRPETAGELAMYQGEDRQAILEEGAAKEGGLTFYATMNSKDWEAVEPAWKEAYPNLPVEFWRGNGTAIVQRVTQEYQAGRHAFDVIDLPVAEMEVVKREGIVREFWSPAFADYPPDIRPAGAVGFPRGFTFYVLGYNSDLVPEAELPRTYEDLLDPRWKGLVAVDAADADWFMTLVSHWGEEKGLAYFDRLAENATVRDGHTQITDLLVAGEVRLGITYSHLQVQAQRKGAPVKWVNLEPVVGRTNDLGLAADPSHPHAALLFLDFFLSEKGQRALAALGRIPSNPTVESDPPGLNKGFDFVLIDGQKLVDELDKWQGLYEDHVLNRVGK